MRQAELFLHALGHGLAAHALYGTGHRARKEAGARLYATLEELLARDLGPTFTFLDDTVLYRSRPLHGLKDWVWSKRLGAAGIRRLEFTREVTRPGLEEFLAALHVRLGREGRDVALPECPGIGAGDVAVGPDLLGSTNGAGNGGLSLGDEVDAVRYAYDRVTQGLRALDDHAALHAVNTAVLTMTFCEWLGLAGGDIRAIGKAALLHDIGMARVPKDIFTIRDLSPAGRTGVARHPEEGARLLLARSAKLDLAATTAYEHHLRVDGQGYPERRFHRDLHYISRIVAVCGAYDALRSERSYRPALDPESAILEIEGSAGTVYDPGIARAFVQMMRRWEHRLVSARPD
jgi:HD-GYP domain-containing protein (c-di-GMP phosphodiesterase class II)